MNVGVSYLLPRCKEGNLKFRTAYKILLIGLVLTACISAAAGPLNPSVITAPLVNTSVPSEPGREPQSRTLTIYAAASLTDAFQEIAARYEIDHPGINVRFSFAGSQILRAQLEQGAIADIIASADQKNMDLLEAEGLVELESRQNFASNHLTVILPGDNPGRIFSLHDLAKPGVKLVLAHDSVPIGNYTLQVLSALSNDPQYGPDFLAAVKENVVSQEIDVRQVVAKVELGEADAGIVYSSDATAVPGLITVSIPSAYNITAEYPVALLANTPDPDLASDFISLINSAAGQEILSRWGFSSGN